MKIKTGDKVKVISGHYKGTVAEVTAVDKKNNKVIVEGVNVVKKSQTPTQANPDGGIIEKEAWIDASNVMYYDEKSKTASRLGVKVDGDKKVRFMKKGGKEIKEGKKK